MADNEPGTLINLKHQLDIETDNSNGKLIQYLEDARLYLEEQVTNAGQEPLTNPTRREKQLIEDYAAGKYILKNTPSHADKPFQIAKNDIKTHIRSSLQKVTDDGVAVGADQFQLSKGNVRSGNGLDGI